LVTKTDALPIECVARGYLSGSAWKDYLATGGLRDAIARRPPRIRSAAAADFHTGNQGAERTRHQHHAVAGGRVDRTEAVGSGARSHVAPVCRRIGTCGSVW